MILHGGSLVFADVNEDGFGDVLQRLCFLLPENLILAALDLIDRESGETFWLKKFDALC